MVVFSHLLVIEKKYSTDVILGDWLNMGLAGVDIFFVISGFIMVHVAMRKNKGVPLRGVKAFFEFLFARITRIYPLYWFVSLALLLVWFWRPDLVFSSIDAKPDLLKSFLLFPDNRPPLLAVGWTLIHEMGFYLVFSLFMLASRKFLPFGLSLWALVLVLANVAGWNNAGAVSGIIFSPLGFEFLAGCLAGLVYYKYKIKTPDMVLLPVLACFFIVAIVLAKNGIEEFEIHLTRTLYLTLPGMVLVYAFATSKWQAPKWFVTLGDWSYSLYLTHVLSLSLIGKIWHKFIPQSFKDASVWDNLLVLFFMLAFSIAVAGLTYFLFEKPALDISKRIRAKIFNITQ